MRLQHRIGAISQAFLVSFIFRLMTDFILLHSSFLYRLLPRRDANYSVRFDGYDFFFRICDFLILFCDMLILLMRCRTGVVWCLELGQVEFSMPCYTIYKALFSYRGETAIVRKEHWADVHCIT